ncbi:hypothetical protein H312_02203 [Anncaliia algerae PRA339]|uniref:ATP-dependent RNA helicase n=1 Tax=Anncaliia algerae PRA339 TaxID=1288291 RepID=A0A059EZT8_9MICR|nr:hypothetical protein H312_02203 [Anncaliia algerae PRA339]
MELTKILEKLNFSELTKVQQETIPHLSNKEDLLVLSPTGSGKTYSFLIPMLQLQNPFSGLIIVPTRELAIQIKESFDVIAYNNSCIAVYGGKELNKDMQLIESNPTIIVSTPGRLLEICEKIEIFKKLEFLILDEADKLFQMGFLNTILKILSYLSEKRTTALFSATLNIDFSPIKMNNPKIINVIFEPKIDISYKIATGVDKLEFLYNYLKGKSKIIVFFSTCACVDYFYGLFVKMGFDLSKIHGKLRQADREKVYDNYNILFTTDVAARGIDFKDIHTVIHFDVPTDPSNFVHRTGRTGRNGKEGKVVLMLNDNESKYLQYLEVKKINISEIEEEFNNPLDFKFFDSFIDDDLLNLSVKAFVSFIRSYKEHVLNYICNYKEINYNKLIQMFFLKKVPRMDELSNIRFDDFKRKTKITHNKKSSLFINKENKKKRYKNIRK